MVSVYYPNPLFYDGVGWDEVCNVYLSVFSIIFQASLCFFFG